MSVYDERPWLSRYDPGQPADIEAPFGDAVAMVAATVARRPGADAIRHRGVRTTFAELDAHTDAFAAGLAAEGIGAGDRVALFLQNTPAFVTALLGAWKAGAIAVPVNPMYRGRELVEVLTDSGAAALVCLTSLHRDVAARVVDGTDVRLVLTTPDDTPEIEAPSGADATDEPGAAAPVDLDAFCARHRSAAAPAPARRPGDLALLVYTSGTTGPPKGAMISHRNVVWNARTYRDWVGLGPDDVILGIAPLFHITGLIGHIAVGLLTGAPLVLMGRFDPDATLATIARERATFTVGAITAFTALLHAPTAGGADFSSLTKVYSGGAPIPPATVEAFAAAFGPYIHNIYGLTETTSPSHAVPLAATAPVDPETGALSVGVPVYNTVVRVVDDAGADVPLGALGELVTSGPQVVSGYWHKPAETAAALPGGALRTGDVGYMDGDGWYYLVDRKKDQINASGFKVWPREVEDVLAAHPAVREAAVVGVPDAYRGETVKAFVALRPGANVGTQELIGFCRERMAAYKYPRRLELVDELPKNAAGKILRRELRDRG